MSLEERARCLDRLGEALQKHADDFFALSQSEWGCVANERTMQVDSAAPLAMRAAQLAAQLADEPVAGTAGRRPCCATSRSVSCRS